VYWDGLNGIGAKVPSGTAAIKIRVFLLGGEVHFPFLDLEDNRNGLLIKKCDLAGNIAVNEDTVYWNDNSISPTNNGPSNPRTTGVDGIRSSVNGHKFGNGTSTGFGNEKAIDTWTYSMGNVVTTTINITIKEADLEVVSLLPNQSVRCQGQAITYTIVTRNNGPDNVFGTKFRLLYPTEITGISCSTSVTGIANVISIDSSIGGQLHAVANMNNLATITYYITGTITAPPSGGSMTTTASIMRSADITDPDATNPDSLPPSDPQVECDAVTVGCNNIKVNSSVTVGANNTLTIPISICGTSGNPPLISGNSPTNITGYSWERSTDGINNWNVVPNGQDNITNSGTQNYEPSNSSPSNNTTYYYRRKALISSCTDSLISNVVTLWITTNPTNSITYDGIPNYCGAFNPPIIGGTPTGGNGTYTYQWQSATNFSFTQNVTNISGATAQSYDPPQQNSGTRYYRRAVTSGACVVNSGVVTIQVSGSQTNTIKSPDPVEFCQSGNPDNITNIANSGTDVIYQWQLSTDGINYTNIAGATSIDYDPPFLNAVGTYYYRRQNTTTFGSGCSLYSNIVTITVSNGITNTLTVPSPNSFCGSGDAGAMSNVPFGGGAPVNYIIQWQISNDSINFTDIVAANSIPYDPPAQTATRYYRRVVSSPTCAPVYSNIVPVYVTSNVITNNSFSPAQTICSGTSPAAFTGSNPSGGIGSYGYQWYISEVSGNSSFAIINGATDKHYTSIQLTTNSWFKRIVSSGVCIDSSSAVLITINPGISNNIISAAQTICTGTAPTALTGLVPSGGNGSPTYQWLRSTTSASSGFAIIGATGKDYSPGILTQNTWYKRLATLGSLCATDSSAAILITVSGNSIGGTVTGGAPVCTGTNSTLLTVSAHTGTVTKWQWSTVSNFSLSVTDVANTSTNLTVTNISSKRYYRAVIANSPCASTNSSVDSITVSSVSVGGAAVSANPSVCTGTNSTVISLDGNSSGSFQWQWSSDNTNWTNLSGQTGATYTATNLTTQRYYRARITSGACALAYSTSDSIQINQPSIGGTAAGTATVCSGSNSTTLTLTGNNGTIIRWESSPDNAFSSPTPIVNTSSSLTVTNLTGTTYYRAVVISGACAAANSDTAAVFVSPNFGWRNCFRYRYRLYRIQYDNINFIRQCRFRDTLGIVFRSCFHQSCYNR
jgi:hypothetical protein